MKPQRRRRPLAEVRGGRILLSKGLELAAKYPLDVLEQVVIVSVCIVVGFIMITIYSPALKINGMMS